MNKFTSASAALLLVACVGTDLPVSIAEALISLDDTPSMFYESDGKNAPDRPAKALTTTASSSDSTDDYERGGTGSDARRELTHVLQTAN